MLSRKVYCKECKKILLDKFMIQKKEKQLTSLNKQISDISKGQDDIQSSIKYF